MERLVLWAAEHSIRLDGDSTPFQVADARHDEGKAVKLVMGWMKNQGNDVDACDVEVQIGEDGGAWFMRTRDDAGGSDDVDDTQYATEKEARAAAREFAKDHDEGDGKSAEQYLSDVLEERASEGEDDEGEFCLYWETSLEDEGERKRYSTYDSALAAAALAQGKFNGANPASGGVTYLCGYSVRRLVDGQWVLVDENGECRE